MMSRTFSLSAFVLPLLFALLLPLSASAATGTAMLKIQQLTPRDIGKWTLFYEGGSLTSESIGIENPKMHTAYPPAGNATFMVVPPSGASASISFFEETELIKKVDFSQINVVLQEGKSYRFLVTYIYNKKGMLGVTSIPTAIPFRMTGPDGKTYRGTTPHTFDNIPVGQYTIVFNSIRGCVRARPANRNVGMNERVVFHMEFDCTSKRERIVDQKRNSKPLRSRRSVIDAVKQREQIRSSKHTGSTPTGE